MSQSARNISKRSSSFIEYEDLPNCLIYPARKKHSATVFFLHGLGDSAKGVSIFLPDLIEHPALDHVRFVLPTAPKSAVTGNGGHIMPSWFDCYSFDIFNRIEDDDGLFRAVGWINSLITKEIEECSIPSNRIIIGGLSQGGATSILTALTTERPLAGLYAMSTYVPLRKNVPKFVTPLAKQIPIMWGHGTLDKQVDYVKSKECAQTLADQLGMSFIATDESGTMHLTAESFKREDGGPYLHFRAYEDMGHYFIPKELEELALWMTTCIPE